MLEATMILTTYTNPAYRMPTPNRATQPRLPKRKRNELHNTPAAPNDDGVFPGSSPRMQVADQLQDLNIHQNTPARLHAYQRRPLQRKRLKRNPGLATKATMPDSDLAGTPLAKYDLHDADEVEDGEGAQHGHVEGEEGFEHGVGGFEAIV